MKLSEVKKFHKFRIPNNVCYLSNGRNCRRKPVTHVIVALSLHDTPDAIFVCVDCTNSYVPPAEVLTIEEFNVYETVTG